MGALQAFADMWEGTCLTWDSGTSLQEDASEGVGYPLLLPLPPGLSVKSLGSQRRHQGPRGPNSVVLSPGQVSVLSATCSEEVASLLRPPQPCLFITASLGALLGSPGGHRVVLDKYRFNEEMRATLQLPVSLLHHQCWQRWPASLAILPKGCGHLPKLEWGAHFQFGLPTHGCF